MKKFLKNLLSYPQTRILVPTSHQLTISDWRADESLVKLWRAVEVLPTYQAMLQTMRNSSPLNYGELSPTPDSKIHRLGLIEGYQMALNNLEAFSKLVRANEPIESTFEKPTE